jgi:hypothetical protein
MMMNNLLGRWNFKSNLGGIAKELLVMSWGAGVAIPPVLDTACPQGPLSLEKV